jgi:hypothetical protein
LPSARAWGKISRWQGGDRARRWRDLSGRVRRYRSHGMKYIICEDFSGRPIPFLFPDKVAHADMREQLPYSRVISAGYIILAEGRFVCSGGDAEIGYFARPEDAEYIGIFFDRRGLA